MIEVLKQAAEDVSKAYDVLAFTHTERALELLAKTRTSLRQAIAELESQEHEFVCGECVKCSASIEKQEPVAKVVLTETLELPCLQWLDLNRQFDFKGGEYLYTHPPQRKPLTDEEIERIYHRYGGEMINCARAIERAHGIKE